MALGQLGKSGAGGAKGADREVADGRVVGYCSGHFGGIVKNGTDRRERKEMSLGRGLK